jgi:hypothetical protein
MEWWKLIFAFLLVLFGIVGLSATVIAILDGSIFEPFDALRRVARKIFHPNSVDRKLNVLAANPSLLYRRYKTAEDVIRIQGSDGNWNVDKYMLGMYNGMVLVHSIYSDVEPEYRTLPDAILPEIKLIKQEVSNE